MTTERSRFEEAMAEVLSIHNEHIAVYRNLVARLTPFLKCVDVSTIIREANDKFASLESRATRLNETLRREMP